MTDALVDTSVAVASIVAGHEAHGATLEALGARTLGLAGHAWFETFSVLTRLPAPARRNAEEVGKILAHNFPGTSFLDPETSANLAVAFPESESQAEPCTTRSSELLLRQPGSH